MAVRFRAFRGQIARDPAAKEETDRVNWSPRRLIDEAGNDALHRGIDSRPRCPPPRINDLDDLEAGFLPHLPRERVEEALVLLNAATR